VTTQKQSPAFLTLITLISDGKYDPLYLRNYANIRVKDQLARIPASARYGCSAAATMRCASGSIRTRSLRAA